ncbi:MAG TPA: TetR/AcrR family transcriptional regulator [Bacteroidales bacterium]|nr:TetR/AcrR family transcriptional regulator [Bacteroidales bacterium]
MNSGNGWGIKESIVRAAQEIFSKYGYKKTTLDDIAKYLGKGKSALYYYYKNKEEIFEAVLAYEVSKMGAELFRALETEKNPPDKLRRYILKRMELFHSTVNFYSAIQQEYLENLPVLERIRKQYDEQELEMISEIIKTGIDQGQFVSKNIRFIAGAIIMAMKGFEYAISKEKDMRQVEHHVDNLLDILFYGIVTRKKTV